MVPKHTSVSEAFAILELDESATFEQVRTAYRQKALRTHPDKNPGDPRATEEFQEVGAAYATLDKHFNRPSEPFGWDDDDSFSSDNSMDNMGFFIFVFDEVFADRFGGIRLKPRGQFRRPPTPESDEQYQERMRQNREAQKLERERQARLEQERKIRRQEEAEREKKEAEERQKVKSAQKKANAEAKKKATAEQLKSQREQAQTLRSSVFAAARRNDTEEVIKGVWEQAIDAAGGEIKPGHEAYIKDKPEDPKETLLHIAAKHNNVKLVSWLDAHNADPEERDSKGMTAFHVALQLGHTSIIRYFIESHPPQDEDLRRSIYSMPSSSSTNALRLALESCEPEVIWFILEHKLFNERECKAAWDWVHSNECLSRILSRHLSALSLEKGLKKQSDDDVLEEMKNLLRTYGGFKSPSSSQEQLLAPNDQKGERVRITTEDYLPSPSDTSETSSLPQTRRQQPNQKFRHDSARGGSKRQPSVSSPPQSSAPDSRQKTSFDRGRGRGYVRGRGRGISRGRFPQS